MKISENKNIDGKDFRDEKLYIDGSSVTIKGDTKCSSIVIQEGADLEVKGSIDCASLKVKSGCHFSCSGDLNSNYVKIEGGEVEVNLRVYSNRHIRIENGGSLNTGNRVVSENSYILVKGHNSSLNAGVVNSPTSYVKAEFGGEINAHSIQATGYVKCSGGASMISTRGNINCNRGYVSCDKGRIRCSGMINSDSIRERNGGVILGSSTETGSDDSNSQEKNIQDTDSSNKNTHNTGDKSLNPKVSDEELVIWIDSLFRNLRIDRDVFKNLNEAYPDLCRVLKKTDNIFDVVRLCRQNDNISLSSEQINILEKADESDQFSSVEDGLRKQIDEIDLKTDILKENNDGSQGENNAKEDSLSAFNWE
jgi:hypothetical protein